MNSLFRTALVLSFGTALRAADTPPAWWTDTAHRLHGIAGRVPADAGAAINVGQLKYAAKQAKAYLDAKAPGGAGAAINTFVAGLAVHADDSAAANIGQLRYVGDLFYDRIQELRPLMYGDLLAFAPSEYPAWLVPATTPDPDQGAVANVGQLEKVFSFSPFENTLTPDRYFPNTWPNSPWPSALPVPTIPGLPAAALTGLVKHTEREYKLAFQGMAAGNLDDGVTAALAAEVDQELKNELARPPAQRTVISAINLLRDPANLNRAVHAYPTGAQYLRLEDDGPTNTVFFDVYFDDAANRCFNRRNSVRLRQRFESVSRGLDFLHNGLFRPVRLEYQAKLNHQNLADAPFAQLDSGLYTVSEYRNPDPIQRISSALPANQTGALVNAFEWGRYPVTMVNPSNTVAVLSGGSSLPLNQNNNQVERCDMSWTAPSGVLLRVQTPGMGRAAATDANWNAPELNGAEVRIQKGTAEAAAWDAVTRQLTITVVPGLTTPARVHTVLGAMAAPASFRIDSDNRTADILIPAVNNVPVAATDIPNGPVTMGVFEDGTGRRASAVYRIRPTPGFQPLAGTLIVRSAVDGEAANGTTVTLASGAANSIAVNGQQITVTLVPTPPVPGAPAGATLQTLRDLIDGLPGFDAEIVAGSQNPVVQATPVTTFGKPTPVAWALAEDLNGPGSTLPVKIGPDLIVLTERRRQHLRIPGLQMASQPFTDNVYPDNCFIITIDTAYAYPADSFQAFLRQETAQMPACAGSFTEVEVEFERDVAQFLEEKIFSETNQNRKTFLENLRTAFRADQKAIVHLLRKRFESRISDEMMFASAKTLALTNGDPADDVAGLGTLAEHGTVREVDSGTVGAEIGAAVPVAGAPYPSCARVDSPGRGSALEFDGAACVAYLAPSVPGPAVDRMFLSYGEPTGPRSLVITEVMGRNESQLDMTTNGTSVVVPDWVEIQNRSTATVSLDGWSLEPTSGQIFTFPAGETLAPGQYALIIASTSPTLPFNASIPAEAKVFPWNVANPFLNDHQRVALRFDPGTGPQIRSYYNAPPANELPRTIADLSFGMIDVPAGTGLPGGAPLFADGYLARATPGRDNGVPFQHRSGMSISQRSCTVAMWVKTDLTTVPPEGRPLLSRGNGNDILEAAERSVYVLSNGRLRVAGTDGAVESSAACVTSGTWKHVAVTYDATAQSISFYSDGVLVSTTGYTTAAPDAVASKVHVGFAPGLAGFVGSLDGVGVWARPLSATEVALLKNNGVPKPNNAAATQAQKLLRLGLQIYTDADIALAGQPRSKYEQSHKLVYPAIPYAPIVPPVP